MRTVLCYGDSNTWGAVPMTRWDDQPRYDPETRWTGVLQRELGPDWQVVAEGLPARTTVLDDPVDGPHLSGLRYLRPCLESHRPIDVLVLMLGTNDFKRRFGMEAEDVAFGIERLLREVTFALPAPQTPRVVLVCPPPIVVTGIFTTMYEGADRKFGPLPALLAELARARGTGFLDAGAIIRSSPVDGIHWEAAAHGAMGRAVAPLVRAA
ncbi:MAG: SGNH/GDSL hydrolase family protein [Devosia sp.]